MLKRVFLSALIFLGALAVLDPALRRFYPEKLFTPEELKKESLEYEASVFSRQRIKRESREVQKNKHVRFHVNSHGYRGPEIETPKTRVRLAIYGGSSVFDPLAIVSWPERLEAEFKKAGLNIEVINAGIPGASSAEITARFLSEVFYINPDVVLFYETWNDIRFFNPQAPALYNLPLFNEDKNHYLYHANALDRFLSENLYSYLVLRYKFLEKVYAAENQNALDRRKANFGKDAEFSAHINAGYKKQVKVNYDTFAQIARSAGVKPILATQAVLPTRKISEADKKRVDYHFVKLNLQGILSAIDLIQTEIRASAKTQRTEFIDVAKDLSGSSALFKDHVHFTDEGSKEFTLYMAHKLKNQVPAKKRL